MVLDSRKLTEVIVTRNAQVPNLVKLRSRRSRKHADELAKKILISKFNIDFVYGQMKLLKIAKNLFIFAVTERNIIGRFWVLKDLYRL